MQDSRLFLDLKWYLPYLKRHKRVLSAIEKWRSAYQGREKKPPLRLFAVEYEILANVISLSSSKKARIEEVRLDGVPILEVNK